jgi:zinc-finger of transposase IS204/IS1001/IS1096/IS1165
LVVSTVEIMDGELWVFVETEPGRRACPTCGTWAESKGRPTVLVRDLEIAGRPTILVWRKRRFVVETRLGTSRSGCDTFALFGLTSAVRNRF